MPKMPIRRPNNESHGRKPLLFKEIRFIDEYMVDWDCARAYIAATGDTKHRNPKAMGEKWSRRDLVKLEIDRRLVARREQNEVTVQRIQREIAAMAFVKVTEFYNPDGSLKDITELSEDAQRAVVSVEKKYISAGRRRKPKEVCSYKIADKLAALQTLARSFGMYQDNLNIKDKTDPKRMSDDELDRTIKDLLSKAGAGAVTH